MGRLSVIGRQHLRIRMWNRRRPFRAKFEILSILGSRGCRGLKSWTLKSPLALARVVVLYCQRSTDLVIAACYCLQKGNQLCTEQFCSSARLVPTRK
ncbi:hypothetical protein DPMN_001675 [Dreissena polymorpha]|uniref:Uncharacterized protein n=1 Tax=Dreissena polymorpha TaxID=45954 RepID=A0A9D4MM54_DREPO|nr:hypothetical protein DPMN_001675 [Dreissena polymorpha]